VRVVISVHDPPVWTMPVREVRRIAAAAPDDEVIDARTTEERARAFADAEVLVVTRLSDAEAQTARRVKWIHSTAVGVGTLLRPSVVSSEAVVTNSRGVHSEAIAEHAVALLLALRRRLHVAAAGQAARRWLQEDLAAARVPVASASRVLVIGLGSIGERIAAMAAALGMRVTGMRRRPELPTPAGVTDVVGPDQLARVLPDADAVVLALPRTEATRALFGDAEFQLMKPSAVLVNIARGRLIDDRALIRALEQGQIAGAGLDAFHQEPLPPDSPLWTLPNVIITPHSAAFAGDYWQPAVDLFLDNLARYRRAEPLLNVVDKARGY
jgi:phosphoglycerate dehydrogenase-like enzyme